MGDCLTFFKKSALWFSAGFPPGTFCLVCRTHSLEQSGQHCGESAFSSFCMSLLHTFSTTSNFTVRSRSSTLRPFDRLQQSVRSKSHIQIEPKDSIVKLCAASFCSRSSISRVVHLSHWCDPFGIWFSAGSFCSKK